MRIAYADPPYPGQSAKHYADHPDYAGEVDHYDLLLTLIARYDGWCLHTSSVALCSVLDHLAEFSLTAPQVRVMAWVKPFAAFKANVPVAYAWEPVLVKAARKPVVKPGMTYRDFCSEPITMQRGLAGAKPEAVCRWLFEVMGCEPDDELVDLFPGSGAVTRAWEGWRSQTDIYSLTGPVAPEKETRAEADRDTLLDALATTECGRSLLGAPRCGTDAEADGHLGLCARCQALERVRSHTGKDPA